MPRYSPLKNKVSASCWSCSCVVIFLISSQSWVSRIYDYYSGLTETMASTDEKPPTVDSIEDIAQGTSSADEDEEFTPEEQKKIIRRVDLRLVTMTGLTYCISLMDRTNLSMAAVAGMVEELRLDMGNRYVCSIPSDLLLRDFDLEDLVYYRVDVLCSLCSLSATYDGYHSEGWADFVPGEHCDYLGGYHDCRSSI